MRLTYSCAIEPKLFDDILVDNATAVPTRGEIVSVAGTDYRVQSVRWYIDGHTEKWKGKLVFNTVDHYCIVRLEHP